MDILSSSSKRIHESTLELYRSRLAGRFCIAIISAIQIISRIIVSLVPRPTGFPSALLLTSSIFSLTMIIIIVVEYILFRKIGSRVAKFASCIDIILLSLYIGDWTTVVISSFNKIVHTDPPTFQVTAIYGFTAFSWRALFVTLIIQKWQLRILGPAIACILCSAYATVYTPELAFLNMWRGACQLVEIVLIIYIEDKIKWRMIWTNLHREKWVQVNNFILNNIPENIMILNFNGESKFISDHCKSFMEKYRSSHQELFSQIRELQQLNDELQPQNSTAIQIERITSQNELLIPDSTRSLKIEALEDLIANFRSVIREKNLQERQFLLYNGKLKLANNCHEKAIEIKISFVNHIENEYLILILRDTTQRDLLVTLQETNKYKDQLLASVSHELRAPLNGNINLVEAAINSPKTHEEIKQTLLTPALRSSKVLLYLIHDILDMSQIKQKKLRLDFQSKNLQETFNNAAQLIEVQAKMKGIELLVEFDSNIPTKFCTDHMRLNQIILNLLSNALKFTNQGFIKLTAKPFTQEENNCIQITVEDSGIGIRQENLHKLFSSSSMALGLSIASNLTDLLAPTSHPGISVKSVLGQGSIFSFIIENKDKPFPHPPEKAKSHLPSLEEIADEFPEEIKINLPKLRENQTSSSTLVPSICSCSKILIVDDNPFNIMAFETILSSLDVKCDSVYSGSACLQKLLSRQNNKTCGKSCQPYSVVFMDQEMPEMTGSETVVEIRRLQDENSIPHMKIIGCTAHKAKEEVDRFMKSGLDSCIFKPISVVMIRDVLKEILLAE